MMNLGRDIYNMSLFEGRIYQMGVVVCGLIG